MDFRLSIVQIESVEMPVNQDAGCDVVGKQAILFPHRLKGAWVFVVGLTRQVGHLE